MSIAVSPISSASFPSLDKASGVKYNPSIEELLHDGVTLEGDVFAANGALVALTGKYTGRSPKDKFTVDTPDIAKDIWWGNNNKLSLETFEHLKGKASEAIVGRSMYVIDTYAGADPKHRLSVRFVVERPYHAAFIKQLLIRPSESELARFKPDWTIVDLGRVPTDPAADGVKGDATVALNFAEKLVLIFGTEYAGEMKKSVFTIMNLILPLKGVMSMHCSANIGQEGDTALFFGLSGTGKTTLSADPTRKLIGDDEHGWSEDGVFNVEGGCYAKCINLSQESEPEIWDAIRRGTVLENVVLDPGGVPDYADASLTENTRAAYPIEYIANRAIPSVGSHPQNIVFLTCDALGVLPPISRLTPEQAMDLFLLGYTAKVAGTEVGVTEPTIVFSTCFGAPFLPLRPSVYSQLLREKIEKHGSKVWLVNTGWVGGAYGEGSRIKLRYTRALLKAAFDGSLDRVPYEIEPFFSLDIPTSCPDVPHELLNPRITWKDHEAYDAQARKLKGLFDENLLKIKSTL